MRVLLLFEGVDYGELPQFRQCMIEEKIPSRPGDREIYLARTEDTNSARHTVQMSSFRC